MSEPTIDVAQFFRRLERVQAAWKNQDADTDLTPVDSLLLVAGGSDEDNPYRKTTAFQTWLLGYEFPSTLMLVAADRCVILAGSSRTKIVQSLADEGKKKNMPVEVITRGKDPTANEKLWDDVFSSLDGKNIGHLAKDKFTGKFVDEWQAYLGKEDRASKITLVDVSNSVAGLMAIKEDDEIQIQSAGAKASMHLMNYFTDEMSNIVDSEQKITHEKLADRVEQQLEVPKIWKGFDAGKGVKFDRSISEWCYTPIIQSGGSYDLRSSAQSDENKLKPGVILCSIGVRYKSYCSNTGRTFIIDPHKTQKDNFNFLVKLQQFVLGELKDGAIAKDIYASTKDKIQAEKPDLLEHFLKNMGFIIGIEFRESSYTIGPKCTKTLKENMVISLTLGFSDVPDPKDAKKSYALVLTDTALVGKNGTTLLSEGLKSADEVMFSFAEEQPAKKDKSSKTNGKSRATRADAAPAARTTTTVVRSKLRNKDNAQNESSERRREHQRELAARRQQEGLEKYADGSGSGQVKEKQWKRFESYQRENQLPSAVKDLQIVVDHRKQTVILPINGFAVPFHIKTIKNAIKQEEGDYTVVRIMFVTPGQITGKKEDTPFEDLEANFIRALTYRSTDNYRFSEVHKAITDLKKESTKRENLKKEMADVIEQEQLEEGRKARLHDTWLRPPFEGKRSTGDVEIHRNGIRWASKARSDHKCDITFANIKHLFFQPCDNELVVLVHVHLKSPIMLGRKKVKDIQFYREASDQSFDETGNRKKRRQHEEDEMEQEQEERRQRARLNKEFKAFADKIAETSNGRFDVDIPFRELGFGGVPFRTNVTLQPSTDCLVHLSEPPFLVVTLNEIEIAHLERVQFGLKNFDMVLVFSDFTRPPVHINTVPMNELDSVRDWLDSTDIPTTEGPVNLNWPAIMKTVNDDPFEFFNEGGWGFLGDKDEGGSDSDESSAGSAFELEEGGAKASSGSSEDDYSEDASASDDVAPSEEEASASEEDDDEE